MKFFVNSDWYVVLIGGLTVLCSREGLTTHDMYPWLVVKSQHLEFSSGVHGIVCYLLSGWYVRHNLQSLLREGKFIHTSGFIKLMLVVEVVK